MKNKYFEVEFRKENGAMIRITPVGDPYGMNFIKEGGSFGEPRFYPLTDFAEDEETASARYEKNGCQIQCRYHFEDDRIVCHMTLKNVNRFPVYLDGRARLSLSADINDRYDSSDICVTNRAHAHIFPGLDSAYINGERMGDYGENLGIVFTEGSVSSYSQEQVKSNDRGYFSLNVTPVVLKSQETYEIFYEIFTHTGKKDFLEKRKAYASQLTVNAPEGFTFVQGDTVSFAVESREKITSARVEIEREEKGNICAQENKEASADGMEYEIDGNILHVRFHAGQLGDRKVIFTVNGRKSYAVFHITLAPLDLVRRRVHFIAEKQQCMDQSSPLYGAYLCYDNGTGRQFFDYYWRDQNASRERIGMGILIAKYLQKEMDEDVYDSLMRYADFLFRETVNAKTGFVSDTIGMDEREKRLYNIPWVSVFFGELYRLTGQDGYVDIMIRTIRYFYEQGGARFYPNAVSFYELLEIVRDSGKEQEWKELAGLLKEHADRIAENGVVYPPHEVNFEQTIAAPAATILLDYYRVSHEKTYLQEAARHLELLRRFDSDAPDYRLNKIPIRFWDDFWFGKQQCFGDTMPHYWSVLSGYCNYLYGAVTGQKEYTAYGRECIRNCTMLFNEKGEGSCAYVYPYEVNGVKGEFYDELANDQDFALYYLLKMI